MKSLHPFDDGWIIEWRCGKQGTAKRRLEVDGLRGPLFELEFQSHEVAGIIGIPGRLRWNRWPPSLGIHGRIRRNPHQRLSQEPGKSRHERYLAVYRLIRDSDKDLALAFDDMRRSIAIMHMLFAGKPKIGKSWLILHAAIAVANGGSVFDFREDQDQEFL